MGARNENDALEESEQEVALDNDDIKNTSATHAGELFSNLFITLHLSGAEG